MTRIIIAILVTAVSAAVFAADIDEFKIKRELVFEFTSKPQLTREGDKGATIQFESKGFCDATVAVENSRGCIVRHLASGVLGTNAPEPFQKNSKKQTLVWDGKDDQGNYLDDPNDACIRVSLGVKPQFEKSLYWSPHKRLTIGKAIDADAIRFAAAPEGVYVSDGTGVDSIRLFDHDGNYIRTVYPFPADKLKSVKDLNLVTLPQSDEPRPLGAGAMHATFLTSGSSASHDNKYGFAAQSLAVNGSKLALGFWKLNRLATDGSTGGLPLEGPNLAHSVVIGPEDMWRNQLKDPKTGPRSCAFSPDGKYIYLSGYGWTGILGRAQEWLNGVTRMEFNSDQPPQLFVGSMKQGDYGNGNGQFKWATSVAVDAQGRVYACDHLNHRIQVFSPDGKFIKAIAVDRPAYVGVHQKTGEIFVLSWRFGSDDLNLSPMVKSPHYTRLGPVDDPQVRASIPLNFLHDYDPRGCSSRMTGGGMEYVAALDSWAETPVVWLSPGKGEAPLLLVEDAGKLKVKRNFTEDVLRSVVRTLPPVIQRQRLYVNPQTGHLYVGEADSGVMKSFKELVEIDPDNGAVKLFPLPTTAEDLCIDMDGLFYLRSDLAVARYDPENWREVPWDYGEEINGLGFDGSVKTCSAMSALTLPATGRPGWFHLAGMSISPKGHLAVTCYNTSTPPAAAETTAMRALNIKPLVQKYHPKLYPGRMANWETHIWDKHGKLICEDAIAGMPMADGIGIDKDDNIYMQASPNRILDGKPYAVGTAETLLKVKAGKGRFLSKSPQIPVVLPRSEQPARPCDMAGNFLDGWIENAEWMYGGVGLSNMGCICWNSRPALDLFARSFSPELSNFSVAMLDSNGNLILRIGQFGNVDDGKPLVAAGGPPNPRSIGGDETALFFPAYLATHTDRRLFIADAGNSRIVSVKIGYITEEKVQLKDVGGAAR